MKFRTRALLHTQLKLPLNRKGSAYIFTCKVTTPLPHYYFDIMQHLPSTFCICNEKTHLRKQKGSFKSKITILLLTAFDKMVMRHSFISGCSLATGFSILLCYSCHAQKMHYLKPFLRYPAHLRIHYLAWVLLQDLAEASKSPSPGCRSYDKPLCVLNHDYCTCYCSTIDWHPS